MLLHTPRVQLILATRGYITSLRPQPLRSIAQRLVDSQIYTLYSYCPRPVTLRCAFSLLTLSLRPILRLYDTADAAKSSASTSYFTLYS